MWFISILVVAMLCIFQYILSFITYFWVLIMVLGQESQP